MQLYRLQRDAQGEQRVVRRTIYGEMGKYWSVYLRRMKLKTSWHGIVQESLSPNGGGGTDR